MLTLCAQQSLASLRDSAHFHWMLLPLLLLVLYAYAEQLAGQRWSVLLGALTFWLMDCNYEIFNALLARLSGFAPLWATPGASAWGLLIGLNSEISLMFAIMGLLAMRLLPADPQLSLCGMNNRWFFALLNALLCLLAELLLNRIGALCWDWRYWNRDAPWLILLLGYLPFFRVAYWVHDMRARRRQWLAVGVLAALAAAALALLGVRPGGI
jgi:hypothetical protein